MRELVLQRIEFYKNSPDGGGSFQSAGRWGWNVNGIMLKDVNFSTLDDATLLNTLERIVRSWNKMM